MTDDLRNEIEQFYSHKIIDEQFMTWGEQYWLELDSNGYTPQSRVSIVKVYPGKEHKIHTHPGYEEVAIGLEGECIHLCNDRLVSLRKGKIGYIRGSGLHRILNATQEPAKFLSIVTPVLPFPIGELSWINDVELDELIDSINLEPIVDRFSRSVSLPVILTNSRGNQLTEQRNLPKFCKLCCRLQVGDCYLCSDYPTIKDHDKPKIFKCIYGVESIIALVVVNEKLLGYLACGYGLNNSPMLCMRDVIKSNFPSEDQEKAQRLYVDLPVLARNHLVSTSESISLITASIVQLVIFSAREKQMNAYRLKLSLEKQRQAELESSLNEVRLKFLESQVNPHFLFNALNTIAQMAIMEGATTVSSLTYSLSNLLRSSLGKEENSLISIKEELDLVNDYLFIQKTRFPSRFDAEIDIDEQVMQVKVPFMMLMVLVENSIVHGFTHIRWQGRLVIKGYVVGASAVIEVIDNGTGVPEDVIDQFKKIQEEGFESGTGPKGIGLKNVYNRLEHFFGARFRMEIYRNEDKGTKVTIKIPTSF